MKQPIRFVKWAGAGTPVPKLDEFQSFRFWGKVKRALDPNSCWPWTGATADGYGRFKVGKRVIAAHRIAYCETVGPILRGSSVVMHTCDNPSCCNPSHLIVGTPKLNAIDMVAKGRQYQPQHHIRGSKSEQTSN